MTRATAMLMFVCAAAVACGGHEPGPVIESFDCDLCHLQEYEAAENPVHVGAFPEGCFACHSTEAWQPEDNSGHDDVFPIFRGEHRGIDCAECHPPPVEFFDFDCIDCHEHRQDRMDSVHSGKSGYEWESHACLRCHPKGGG